MEQIFKDEAKEEGASITDLVLSVLRLLKEDTQEAVDFIKLVELQNKGQPSHVISLVYAEVRNVGI